VCHGGGGENLLKQLLQRYVKTSEIRKIQEDIKKGRIPVDY